jgi:hypothetical protein
MRRSRKERGDGCFGGILKAVCIHQGIDDPPGDGGDSREKSTVSAPSLFGKKA